MAPPSSTKSRPGRALAVLIALIIVMLVAIVGKDTALRFTVWNYVMEAMTGVTRARVLGRTSAELFPGFDGTPRPDWTDSVADLAVAYLDLIDELGLDGVMVIGSSIGGWIAAEMGLRDTRGRIACLTLIDAVGIKPEPPLEIADT